MKRKIRKFLLTLSAALLLVTLTVGVTVAYLTDSEAVTNTFTVGQVHIMLDEADVYEAKDVEEGKAEEKDLGTPIPDAARVKANQYKLIPGHTYTKDPTMYLRTDSVKSFVRMKVEITNITNVKKVFGDTFLPQDFVNGWNDEVWKSTKVIDETSVSGSAIYEFRYHEIVDVTKLTSEAVTVGEETYKALPELFTSFTVDGEKVTEKNIEELKDVNIIVTAHAIQADGFKTVDEAWEAFDNQNP